MRRNIPKRTLLSKDPVIPGTHTKLEPNFCPLPPRRHSQESSLSEGEKLIIRFQQLIDELRQVRGKLYRLGIDPEKYSK